VQNEAKLRMSLFLAALIWSQRHDDCSRCWDTCGFRHQSVGWNDRDRQFWLRSEEKNSWLSLADKDQVLVSYIVPPDLVRSAKKAKSSQVISLKCSRQSVVEMQCN